MPSPKNDLKKLGLAPSRARGQNFLRDPLLAQSLAQNILDLGPGPILEIGPGLGAVTKPLLASGARIIAVELDNGLAEALKAWPEAKEGRLTVLNQDILTLNLQDLDSGPLTVAGNLPYNLSTPILFWFLAQTPLAKAGLFTLQREMAQRLLAKPGESSYGRLTVAMTLWAEVKFVLDAPPTAFQPRPKVHSVAVSLKPKTPPPVPLKTLESLTKAAFHARRKTLGNNLFSVYGREKTLAVLKTLNVEPSVRAETLAPEILLEMAILLKADSE
jgi:16S rRNA (adenine1518-N6/adenine1519-N6)-dimethyltransferase